MMRPVLVISDVQTVEYRVTYRSCRRYYCSWARRGRSTAEYRRSTERMSSIASCRKYSLRTALKTEPDNTIQQSTSYVKLLFSEIISGHHYLDQFFYFLFHFINLEQAVLIWQLRLIASRPLARDSACW